uniref:Uncharacterized protein n=1 Tax=Tetranychus urticae TaxID=32264 RepID=T1KTX1_TETUR
MDHSSDEESPNVSNPTHSFTMVVEMSNLLKCDIDLEELTIAYRLIESNVNSKLLAHAIKSMKNP